MSPPRVGLVAVFDVATFNQGIQTYVRSLAQVEKNTADTARQLRQLGTAAGQTHPQVSNLGNQSRISGVEIRNLGYALSTALGTGAGYIIVGTIQRIIESMRQLVGQGVEVASFFERLQIGLQNLGAVELFDTGQVSSVAEGLDAAAGPAQTLVNWIKQLAILSPFQSKDVANAFRLAEAYGFSAQEAQRLTKATVDFVSATGREGTVIERITLALGQVRQATRLTGLETRQLTEAGIPVIELLAEAWGKTTFQIRKMIEDGVVPANEAIRTVTEYLESRFGGAAERQAQTLSGLVSSMKDIKEIGLAEVFRGIGESMKPFLQSIVDLATQGDLFKNLRELGYIIGTVLAEGVTRVTALVNSLIATWKNLSPETREAIITFTGIAAALITVGSVLALVGVALSALANPFIALTLVTSALLTAWTTDFAGLRSIVEGFGRSFNDTMNNIVSTASYWGSEITRTLAEGIESAVDSVISAIEVIGEVMSFWMQPGSPPRFLPDIDTWGKQTADTYLSGWKEADFNIIGDFGSIIQRQLSALVDIGQLEEIQVPRLILGSRQVIAQAIDDLKTFGAVTQTTLSQIEVAAGPASQELRRLIELYADSARATMQVTEAQDELNRITERYDKLLAPLRDKLRQVSDAQSDVADQRKIIQLQRIIANEATTASQKEEARLEIERIRAEQQIRNLEEQKGAEEDTAKAQLDAAKQAQDEANSILDDFKARLKAQTDSLDLYGQEKDILDKIQKASNQRAKSQKKAEDEVLKALKDQLRWIQLQQEELQDLLKIAKAEKVLNDATSTEYERQNALLDIQSAKQRQLIRDKEAAELGHPGGLAAIRSTQIVAEDIETAEDKFKNLQDEVDSLAPGGLTDIGGAVEDINKSMDDARKKFQEFTGQFANIGKALKPITDNWQTLAKVIAGVAAVFTAGRLITGIASFINILLNLGKVLGIFALGGKIVAGVQAGIAAIAAVIGSISLPILAIIAAVVALAAAWYFNWGGIQEKTKAAVEWIKEQLASFDLSVLVERIKTFFSGGFGDVINRITGFVLEVIRQITAAVPNIVNGLAGWLVAFIEWVGQLVADVVPRFFTFLGTLIQSIYTGIPQAIVAIGKFLGDMLKAIFEWSKANLPRLILAGYTILVSLISGIVNNFFVVVNAILRLGEALIGAIIAYIVPAVFQAGYEVLKGFIKGIVGALATVLPEPTRQVGMKFIDGVFESFEGAVDYSPVGNFGKAMIDNAKESLGISGGTSKVTKDEIGLAAGAGVFAGLNEAASSNSLADFTEKVKNQVEGVKTNTAAQTTAMKDETTTTFGSLTETSTQYMIDLKNNTLDQLQGTKAQAQVETSQIQQTTTADFMNLSNTVVSTMAGMREQVLIQIVLLRIEMHNYKDTLQATGAQLGRAIGDGMIDGIRSSAAAIAYAAASAAIDAINYAKRSIGAASPSKLAAQEVGAPLAQGIAVGILDNIGAVANAAQLVSNSLFGAMNSGIGMGALSGNTLPGTVSNVSSVRNYNLSLSTMNAPDTVIRSFRIMETMA